MKTYLKASYFIKYIFIGCVFFLSIVLSKPVHADIYMYLDADGVLHFTNIPMASKHKPSQYKVWKKKSYRRGPGRKSYNGCYDKYIKEASRRSGISFYLLKAIIRAESDFNPKAVSRAGAMGLMQLMPENVKMLAVSDPFDPWQNIMAGTSFFKNMLKRFNGNLSLSLAAYNAGPNAVERYKTIPPYEETQNYVQKVLKYYAQYKQEHRG